MLQAQLEMNRNFKSPELGYAAPNDPRLKPRPPIIARQLQQERLQQQQQQQQQFLQHHLQSNQQELAQRLRSEQGGPNIVQQNTDNIGQFHSQQPGFPYPDSQPQSQTQPQHQQQRHRHQHQQLSQSQPQPTDTQAQMRRNVFKIKSRPKKNDRQLNGNSYDAAPLTAGAAVIATKSPPKSYSVTIAPNGNSYHSSVVTSNGNSPHSRPFNPLIPSSSAASMSFRPAQTITTTPTKSDTPPLETSTSELASMAFSTPIESAISSPITAAQASLAGLTGSPARPTTTTVETTTAAQATIAATAGSPKAPIPNPAKKPTLSWAPTVAPHSTPRKQSSPLKSIDKPEPVLIELSPPTTPEIQRSVAPVNSTPKKPPPDSMKEATPFQWELYFQIQPGQAAPKEAFMQSHELMVNHFQKGMKLEARDPKNSSSWCLATVLSIEGLRIKLRFDGAGDNNDFYELINSESIRAYGSKPEEVLLPPISFEGNIMNYSKYVDKVLSKNESIVAPVHCFQPIPRRPPANLFKVGMKLEAIDRKNPLLICPASIGEVRGDDVKILFDGWRGSFDYTCKYYCRDIFPINWCRDNNYYLTPPNGWEQTVASKSANRAQKDLSAKQKPATSQPSPSVNASKSTSVVDLGLKFPNISSQLESSDDDIFEYPDEIKYQCQRVIPYNKWPRRKNEESLLIATNASAPIIQTMSSNSVVSVTQSSTSTNSSTSTSTSTSTQESLMSKSEFTKRGRGRPRKKLKLDDEPQPQFQHALRPVPAIRTEPSALKSHTSDKDSESDTDPPVYESWSEADVVEYIKSQEPELEKYTQAFVEQEISGIAFVSLIPEMMIRHLGLKLGPALRIARLIERLRRPDSV